MNNSEFYTYVYSNVFSLQNNSEVKYKVWTNMNYFLILRDVLLSYLGSIKKKIEYETYIIF